MPRQSAGLLLYRYHQKELQFFLVHPGGPYFVNKNEGTWSIPKGEFTEDEKALSAAQREFEEETGQKVSGPYTPLQTIKQKGGKLVHAWAVEGNIDADAIVSNTFKMEYPYKSGKWITVPEVDAGRWFNTDEASMMINQAQKALIEELSNKLLYQG
ncbi:NUDIX domain-containing protein [Mucilaginibacter sp. CSA2-8R]|uniref:NUDIX domain-containing protein n=1 Tax=Mucilaginibacter sp. CSA2-8R TaxID=3141542 RepID=UPI00315D4696